MKAGAKLTFGTDAGGLSLRHSARRQFTYMVRYGMTPMQAIRSATVEAAKALGKEGQMGTLAAGAYGDLIAVAGDPLADIRALERVDGCDQGRKARKVNFVRYLFSWNKAYTQMPSRGGARPLD